jgi:hypothetical protein
MKTNYLLLRFAVALVGLPTASRAQQTLAEPPVGSRLTVGPVLGNVKVKDLQASPLMYVANSKGVQLAYDYRAARSLFRVEMQASTSTFIAPALGPRQFTFTDEKISGETTSGTMVLAPSLYQGNIDVRYVRRVNTANPTNKWRSYAGLSLHNWLGYADGVAMTTWATNAATLNAALTGEWNVRPGHLLTLSGAVPLMGALTRLPYSNVLSYPDNHSYFDLFFSKGTRLATWDQLQRVQLQAGYQASLSPRLDLGVQYRFEWFHYRQPRSITTLSNQGALQLAYKF